MKNLLLSKKTILAMVLFLAISFGQMALVAGAAATSAAWCTVSENSHEYCQDWVSGSGAGWGPGIEPESFKFDSSANALSEEELKREQLSNSSSFATIKALKDYVTPGIYAREGLINAIYTGDSTNLGNELDNMLEEILTGDDYLYYTVERWGWGYQGYPGNFQVRFEMNYRTTRAQEDFVEREVSRILGDITTNYMNDHRKVKAIHDYIVKNTAYDTTLTRYTAYDILAEGKAVCQGYALLAYKMLNEVGVTVRIISGNAGGEAHAWNMVQLDGNWYHLDCTWNDPIPDVPGRVLYNYYLITDAKIAETHSWNQSMWPDANTSYVDPGDQAYTLVISSSPAGGGSVSGSGSYDPGVYTTVTATPNSGYKFVNWTENAQPVSTSSTYSFTITGNRNLVANFEKMTTTWTPWPKMYNQRADKEWTILFNQDIYAASIDQNTVWIKDSRGNKIVQNRIANERSVVIKPPQGGYQQGESYTLYISDSVKSWRSLPLSRAIKMEFTIE